MINKKVMKNSVMLAIRGNIAYAGFNSPLGSVLITETSHNHFSLINGYQPLLNFKNIKPKIKKESDNLNLYQ